jgi:hypothetical protein
MVECGGALSDIEAGSHILQGRAHARHILQGTAHVLPQQSWYVPQQSWYGMWPCDAAALPGNSLPQNPVNAAFGLLNLLAPLTSH